MSMTGARGTHSSEINVTPLIDVLLVLLIIFMTILPERHWGEKTLIPQPAPEKPRQHEPETPIVIELKDAGESKPPRLKVNQEEVSWNGLEARLAAAYKPRVDRVAFVKGDPEVEFEYVAQAVDISHHAGADRIGLIGRKD
jgi:biopolymer transport protein ExbD